MDVKEAGSLGGKTTITKNPNHFKDLAKKRFSGMTPEEKSQYMKKVRAGKTPHSSL